MKVSILDKYSHVFFIGIGGISMSGLSEVLNQNDKKVYGSDQHSSSITEHLKNLGITVYEGHDPSHIKDEIDLVVYTAAIKKDNVEYQEAIKKNIDIMDRGTLLGHIMDSYKVSIGVAGTHGKTTTTSMLSHIMLEGHLDPTISVGGILKGIGGNFRIGKSDYFITEACEYTNSYHKFFPNISIILNIEEDHMDFFKDYDDIENSFKTYIGNTKPGGTLILNDTIKNIAMLTKNLKANVITVGKKAESYYSYENETFDGRGFASFDLVIKGEYVRRFQLMVTGYHNIENALATIAAARTMGISFEDIQKGLLAFGGTDRRFEYKGSYKGASVIDDYAHHPTEITKTLEAASKIEHNHLWVVFQPHTYTRTKAFFQDFIEALRVCDHLIITDIYAAREKDPGDIHASMLVESLGNSCKDIVYIDDFEKIVDFLSEKLMPKDMLITMGAGTVTNIGNLLLKK